MPEVATKQKIYRFAELTDQINDRVDNPAESGVERYVGLEHLDADSLRIRRWGDVTDVESTKLRFQPGDIIFGKRRVYQRKLAVADFEGICSAHAMVLRANPDVVIPEFLPYFMQSDHFMERALEISVGSLSPTINWKTLAAELFALPPIEEQRRICRLMTAVDTSVMALRDVERSLDCVRSALVEKAVQDTRLRRRERTLGDLCTRITDGTHQPPRFAEEGIPFFLVKTISGGLVNWDHTKFVSSDTYAELTKTVRPKRGDVIYTAVGATYGVALPIDFDEPFVFQRHIAHLVPNPHEIDGHFLSLFLNSPLGKRQSDASALGSAQPTVTLESLRRFRCPCPSLEQQKQLVAKVESLNRVQEAARSRSARITAIRNEVLRGAVP